MDAHTRPDLSRVLRGVGTTASAARLADRELLLAGLPRWLFVDAKRPHTHDVRVLLMLAPDGQQPLMLSAGNDTQLVVQKVNRFTQEHPTRICRVPQAPLVAAPAAATEPSPSTSGGGSQQDSQPAALVTAERDHVDVWRIKLASRKQMVSTEWAVPVDSCGDTQAVCCAGRGGAARALLLRCLGPVHVALVAAPSGHLPRLLHHASERTSLCCFCLMRRRPVTLGTRQSLSTLLGSQPGVAATS